MVLFIVTRWQRIGAFMSFKSKAKYMLSFSIINFALYFLIQSMVTQHQFDLMTTLDEVIPFMPEHIWIYHSILPVIAVTMLLLVKSKKTFFMTFWTCVAAMAVLNISYLLFPSFYPRPEFEINTLSELLVDMTRKIDGANNTFPSGHVTFAWVMFWGICHTKLATELKGIKSLYCLWALGISMSTLVLKQHYIVDVFSGFSLALTCFFLVKSVIEYYNLYEEIENLETSQ